MVKGCRRELAGLESGCVWLDGSRSPDLFDSDFWIPDFHSSYTHKLIACGDPNLRDDHNKDLQNIFCKSCLIKQGFLW